MSKLFESVVYVHLKPIISRSIPYEQHGFMKHRSTVTNLDVFTDYVLRSMDDRCQVDVIYTDFEKAFDRVDHVILLQKLSDLGINGNLLRWVTSYIKNRMQAVVTGSARSNFIIIPSGVPQGSILGPLFYNAYPFDIGSCFRNAQYLMFADDMKVFFKIRSR